MARTKQNITISLETDLIHEFRLRNLKGQVSQIINDLLKTYLQINKQEVDLEEQELEKAELDKKAELMVIEEKKALIKQKREEAEEELKKQIANGEVINLDDED